MLFLILSVLEDEQKSLVEKIYKDHYQHFFYIAAQITGSRANAEEVVSEALIKISLNIQRISELSCPEMKAFCVTIVKNCAYDLLRKNSKVILDSDELVYNDGNPAPSPEHEVEKQEKTKNIRKMLEGLSDDDKELLEMRYTYEMKYAEIARYLSITEETAKKRGQRIINRLRKQYEETKLDEYDF